MKRTLPSVALALAALAIGCSAEKVASPPPAAAAERAMPAAESRIELPRKLIKTVDLDLEVEDTAVAAASIEALAAEHGGFVSAMTSNRWNDLVYYRMTLRVPVDRLDETVARIRAAARTVLSESMRTEDVTAEFVDVEARLRTLKATEEELLQLLAESRERQQKAEDIMAIYERLTEMRTRIEQLEGRLEVLRDLTTLSTINVALAPVEGAKPIVGDPWRPSDTARRSARALVSVLQTAADLAIGAVIVLLPTLLLVGVPVWWLARFARRLAARRRRKATE